MIAGEYQQQFATPLWMSIQIITNLIYAIRFRHKENIAINYLVLSEIFAESESIDDQQTRIRNTSV
jgi:hypothetical protein